jgi:hypothetical protein
MTINDLVDEKKDFDGVYFCKTKEGGDDIWSLTFLNLNEKKDRKFEQHDVGLKYQVMFHNNGKVELFEAILGDPSIYLKNLLDSDQEGLIIKKCKRSKKIISQILGKEGFRKFREIFES